MAYYNHKSPRILFLCDSDNLCFITVKLKGCQKYERIDNIVYE